MRKALRDRIAKDDYETQRALEESFLADYLHHKGTKDEPWLPANKRFHLLTVEDKLTSYEWLPNFAED